MAPAFDNEFPSNSHKSKVEPEPVEAKVVEKVISGSVVRQKPSIGKRLSTLFITEDPRSVVDRMVLEVLIPGVKDLAVDFVIQSIEKSFGSNVSARARQTMRATNTGVPGYVSYNRYASSTRPTKPSPENPRQGIGGRTQRLNLDDIILDERDDALEALRGLEILVAKYERASVADLYDLLGIVGVFTDVNWGWRDVSAATVQRVRGGKYLLQLPEPIPLKE